MEKYFDENGEHINLKNVELLSDKGSECIVYVQGDKVLKIFRNDYKFSHLSKAEMQFLMSIPTKRILMPTGLILNENGEPIGYQMRFIKGKKDIQTQKMRDILSEFDILRQDIKILNKNNIGLRDLTGSNTVFDGHIYLIDPGNYIINNPSVIASLVDPLGSGVKDSVLLEKWNNAKLNQLADTMLFINEKTDSYQFRLIVQFFIKERENKGVESNLDLFPKFFDMDLTVEQSVEKFKKEHLTEDEDERRWYLGL